MSSKEKNGFRDQEYSQWHRADSIDRYVPRGAAETMFMNDIDAPYWIEGAACGAIGLVETKVDTGKHAYDHHPRLLLDIAKNLKFEVFCGVLWYKKSAKANPAYPSVKDIDQFKWKMLYPVKKPLETFTPHQWANHLLEMRKHFELKKARFLGDKD